MKRTPIPLSPEQIPEEFRALLQGAAVFDSNSSPDARVYYIDKGKGYFLKTSSKGRLAQEAQMTRYFHGKGLSASVLSYRSGENDWLLTERIPGEDCTREVYLEEPKRLCDTLAVLLRRLHETPFSGCPVPDRTERYLETAARNHRAGRFDTALLSSCPWKPSSAQDAWKLLKANAKYLRTDTLLHGDYCLPNILLRDWRFSGFIDLDCAGVGDRHIDLFWGIWSLRFNLKTDAWTERFLDAYGRDMIESEMLRVVAAAETFG